LSFIYPIYIYNWGNINTIYVQGGSNMTGT